MKTAEMAFQHIKSHCLFDNTDLVQYSKDFSEMTKAEFIATISDFAKHDDMPLAETALCCGQFYNEVHEEIPSFVLITYSYYL